MAAATLKELNTKLTQARADAQESGKAKSFAVDGKGLRIRVRPSGEADFAYRFKVTRWRQNKQTGELEQFEALPTELVRIIGRGEISSRVFAEAESKYHELRTHRRQGTDPQQVRKKKEAKAKKLAKKEARKAANKQFTCRALVNYYLEAISDESNPDRYRRTWSQIQRFLAPLRESPALAGRPASKITTKDCDLLLEEIRRRGPVLANQVRRMASAAWNFAIRESHKGKLGNVWLDENPWTAATRSDEKPRENTLSVAERRKLVQAIADTAPCVGRDATHLLLLTACRRNEVMHARRAEFDLSTGEWVIPAERMKAGEPHTVLLSRQAREIVERNLAYHDSEFLFPNQRHSGRPADATTAYRWIKDLQAVAGDSYTLHDMRRSAATWMGERLDAEARMPVYPDSVIDRVLAHKRQGIVAVYNQARQNEPARIAWQDWADHLDSLLDESVTPLEARA